MTKQTTINFNEIQGKHKENIDKIIKKPYDQLSQQDLLDARNILDLYRDSTWQDDEQNQIINKLLNITLDSQLYRPMDQRPFIEYVIDIIYDWVDQNLEYNKATFNTIDVFDAYFADGTMTYNTQQTLNYIRAFWDDFHPDDVEDIQTKSLFERPEAFLVRQSFNMGERILEAIFGYQETYNKKDFINYIDNAFDAYDLVNQIY